MLEILHTLCFMKTSKNVVRSGCLKIKCVRAVRYLVQKHLLADLLVSEYLFELLQTSLNVKKVKKCYKGEVSKEP